MESGRTVDFDRIVDRSGTESVKWDKYANRDVIPLWLADMDFVSPSCVMEALHRRVDHGVFGYGRAPDELNEVVLEMLLAEYDWRVEGEWLVWLPGLVTGLNVVCRAIGEVGDTVLTAVPVYPYFLSAARRSRRELTTVPLLNHSGRWTLDFDQLERAVTKTTRLCILCNPHNPVGRVYTADELHALASFCEQHEVVLCSDEIHCGLVLDEDTHHVPVAALSPEIARHTVTMMSPSKTFNLAGLGVAFAVIPDTELRRRFRGAMSGIVPWVNVLAYEAALAAYREGSEWHSALLSYLRANRDEVEAAVERMPGLEMNHVEATYLAWIDTRATGLEDPVSFFEQAGVGLADGEPFGGPGFVRLGFGTSRGLLIQALERMEKSLERLGLG